MRQSEVPYKLNALSKSHPPCTANQAILRVVELDELQLLPDTEVLFGRWHREPTRDLSVAVLKCRCHVHACG